MPLFLQLCCADLLAATSTNTERSDADHLSSPLRIGDTIAIIPTARAISPDELSAGIALVGSGGLPVKIGSGAGRMYRTFNVFDGPVSEALNITIEASLPTQRVIRELAQLIEGRAKPECMGLENGPRFIAHAALE